RAISSSSPRAASASGVDPESRTRPRPGPRPGRERVMSLLNTRPAPALKEFGDSSQIHPALTNGAAQRTVPPLPSNLFFAGQFGPILALWDMSNQARHSV